MRRLLLLALTAAGAAVSLLLLLASAADASPAAPVTVTLDQPDGSTTSARLYGDEFLNGYETPAGFTLVPDEAGAWTFAQADDEGRLVSSGVRPGPSGRPPADLGLEPHLRDLGDVADAATEREGAGEDPIEPALGTQDVLVVLAQFSDRSLTTAPADWSELFFGPTGSVSDYYDRASLGAYDLAPAVETQGTVDDGVVVVTLPTPHPDNARDFAGFQETAEAILEAADASVDFAAHDDDADGSLSPDELHLGIVAAGSEAATGCTGPSVWAHRTSIDSPVTADGVVLGDHQVDGGFFAGGELQCDGQAAFPATVGIWVHELGHDLGLIDLYDVDGSSGGVDRWSVMGIHWLALPGEAAGTRPPMPDPFSRWSLGWIAPTQVTVPTADVALDSSALDDDVAQVLDNPGGVDVSFLGGGGDGEYFLVENRQPAGLDIAIPGCGVLVWHIDESSSSNGEDDGRRVDVEEAGEGRFQFGYADAEDPYPSDVPPNAAFGPTSSPDSTLNSGLPTGVALTDFTSACAPTMTVDVDPGGGPVPRPVNDRLANAKVIRLPPSAAHANRTVRGHNVGATVQPGEPVHVRAAGRSSSWWVVRAPRAGYLTITSQSTFREAIAVYTGPSVGRLTRVEDVRGTPPDAGAGAPSEHVFQGLGFRVERNVRYLIAVDSVAAGGGGIRMTVGFDAARPDVRPVDQVVDPGERPRLTMQVRNTSELDRMRVYGWAEGFAQLTPTDCPATFVLQPGARRTCHLRSRSSGPAGAQLKGKVTAWIEWLDAGRYSFTADSWFARVRA